MPRLGSLPNNFVLPGLVVLGLFLVSAYLRTNSLGESLWMDEGLSIGIASQPLLDIPSILRMDGSPPLYYMLLSVWMDLVGDGPGATQALSVAVALVAIRGERVRGMGGGGRYADLAEIYDELEYAESIHKRLGCPVIEVSNLVIEETARRIVRIVEERRLRSEAPA